MNDLNLLSVCMADVEYVGNIFGKYVGPPPPFPCPRYPHAQKGQQTEGCEGMVGGVA